MLLTCKLSDSSVQSFVPPGVLSLPLCLSLGQEYITTNICHSVQHHIVLTTYVYRRFSSRNYLLMYSLAIFNVLYLDYPLILTCVTYSCDKYPSKENLRKAQFGFQLMREVVARRPHGSRLSHTSTVCYICSQEVAVLVLSFVSSVLRTPAQGVELPMFPVGISP